MIFALADVPLVYNGQEVSAQDLNNLAQNTEILEQIVNGPLPLFLSNWKYAPPVYFLTQKKIIPSGTLADIPEIEEMDVWAGSFIFREGMHTLRLGFKTFPMVDGAVPAVNKVSDRPSGTPDSASLFLVFRYTDVSIKELLSNTNFKNYARSWVYWSSVNSKYKQPHNAQLNSYSFIDTATSEWDPHNAANNAQLVDGYAEYKIDLTQFNFVQGEIVTLKFKIALRDGTQVVAAAGRTFYFSMVYANIDHDLHETAWTSLPSITGLNQLPTLINNQKYLVTFFKKYDNPLRAGVWDQVLVGTSYFPIHTGNDASFVSNWGFSNQAEIYRSNVYTQQSRYYTQKNFSVLNTITTSFLVNVNSQTAFTLQGILSNSGSTAMSYRLPYGNLGASPTLLMWNGKGTNLNNTFWPKYNGTTSMDSQVSRQGKIHSVGVRTIGTANYNPVLTISGITQNNVTNKIPFSETAFIKQTAKSTTPAFGGFYFIRPSPVDGGVTYYGQKSGLVLGTSTKFFFGPKTKQVDTHVGTYADMYNFTLVPQSNNSNRFYPALYGTLFSGLDNHSVAYLQNDPAAYTDFSIDIQESANSGTTWDNKASYISTIRIADVVKKSSVYVVHNFARHTSFEQLPYSGLIASLDSINSKLNEVKAAVDLIDEYRYAPVFWGKPKSMIKEYERIKQGSQNPNALRISNLEELSVYFSKLRQADYLVVRGKNIVIGWGGFNKLYRDNPVDIFPQPLQFEFNYSQTLTNNTIETVIVGFSTLSALSYGERYYLTGDVYYAAETMGVP